MIFSKGHKNIRRAGSHTRFKLAGSASVRMFTVGQPPARKSYQMMELAALPFFGDGGA
jgi:hypothetical protein